MSLCQSVAESWSGLASIGAVVVKHRISGRAEVIILVALIALARKIIIIDVKETSYPVMIGMAALLLALGVTYFLVGARHDLTAPATQSSPP